ncbi:MAG: GNAT family N-acetyltransferase [Planctomycetes bacterium]|nr:GNAT family N-acetyltransferase [Planctomycetota bacterium]
MVDGMNNSTNQEPPIEVLSAQWQRPALELLLQGLARDSRSCEIERLLVRLADLETLRAGLVGVVQSDQLLGAAWAEMQPGRTATIWPPCIVGSDEKLGGRLALAAVEAAFSAGAKVAQAVISPLEVSELRWLEAAGLRPVADMECLVWQVPSSSASPLDEAQNDVMQWKNYAAPTDRRRLEALLGQSWIGSLDCPALDGMREPAEVLDGYLAAGTSQAQHWCFLRSCGADAGCLLLAEHADSDEMELVYMGLVAELRGHGHGHALVQMAQRLTRRSGRSRLTTAVDAANAPASAVYAAAGFICYDRRRVLLRSCA